LLSVHEFSSSTTIETSGEAPTLSATLEEQIESLWQAEQQRRGKAMFNGRILSATIIGANQIVGHFVEYRRLIAQQLRPELFEVLRVQAVAVSGLLYCQDGVVFGRRAGNTTQEAGQYELVPSGGIDESQLQEAGRVDFRAQLFAELLEETGIGEHHVSTVEPFCLVEDHESHGFDIGFTLSTPMLSAEAIYRMHRETGSKEYDELIVVPSKELPGFVEQMGTQLVAVSSTLLRTYQ